MRRLLTGLATLFRLIPVLSWSVSAVALGLAAAVGRVGWQPAFALDAALILAGAAAFQGFVAHAANDFIDWRSGTDLLSAGQLSGGSRVLPRAWLREADLVLVTGGALLVGLGAASALFVRRGEVALVVAAVAAWSSLAYTLPPFRLAYRPLVGELGAGWPAVLTLVVGTAAALSGEVGAAVWGAGALQATMCVGWLMHHHLPDVAADLAARPTKLTTPAWLFRYFGPRAARLPAAGYYLSGALGGTVLGILVHPLFLASAVLSGLAAAEGLRTDPLDVGDITRRQLRMMAFTAANALVLAWGFLVSGLGAA